MQICYPTRKKKDSKNDSFCIYEPKGKNLSIHLLKNCKLLIKLDIECFELEPIQNTEY